MLAEMINEYIKAKNAGNKELAEKIVRDLDKLGMDRHTLNIITKDREVLEIANKAGSYESHS